MRRWTFSIWKPVQKAAGLESGAGLHTLRHYYTSRSIRFRESIKTVQKRLGHSSAKETGGTRGPRFTRLDAYGQLWPTPTSAPARQLPGCSADRWRQTCDKQASPSRWFPWSGKHLVASRSVSRILCPFRGDGHLSGATVTDDLDAAHLQTLSGQLVCTGARKRPLGLAPDGVYIAARVTTDAGGLLHHPFTLTGRSRRSTFCCTFPRVTPGGRYPPSCPVESGLSSTDPEGSAATAQPTRRSQCIHPARWRFAPAHDIQPPAP